MFGLIPDSEKDDTTYFPNGKLYYSEYMGQGSLQTVFKGKTIRTDDYSLERRSLEMRINIERQILRVGSLPNYDSVVQIDDPKQIEPATPYRFFLWGLREKTNKMVIKKLEAVS